jgi:RNA polymerase sigma factor (sigma-70 family)
LEKVQEASFHNDYDLLLGLKNNRPVSFDFLYKQYFRQTERLVFLNSGSSDDAKDIFQESVLVLYEKLQNENFGLTCSIKTYLYSVSKNLWLKKLNSKGTKNTVLGIDMESVDVEHDVEEHTLLDEQILKLNNALEKLGEPCQTLLKSFYINGLNLEKITQLFNYSNSDTAKTQKYKCLQRLKKIFFEI